MSDLEKRNLFFRGAIGMLNNIRTLAKDLDVYYKDDLEAEILSFCEATWTQAEKITQEITE